MDNARNITYELNSDIKYSGTDLVTPYRLLADRYYSSSYIFRANQNFTLELSQCHTYQKSKMPMERIQKSEI